MTEPKSAPALLPLPPLTLTVVNLEPKLATAPSAQLLANVPWDGPRLDPEVLTTRAMLAWLR